MDLCPVRPFSPVRTRAESATVERIPVAAPKAATAETGVADLVAGAGSADAKGVFAEVTD